MSFLQPLMLYGLPLMALPIIIHLINQYRYRTIDWAAMYFLLVANKMSRGYARIRQWLILLFRTLAIAGLVFAISRPLASGWMRLASPGHVDTTIILLDRSPSMQQQGTRAGVTKLASAKEQLVQSLSLLESNRWILIDSVNNEPIELKSPEDLESMLETEPVSASADIPAMLETVHKYLRDQKPSRTEVWICSDLREHDWNGEGARWDVLRDGFLQSPFPIRFHLLSYAKGESQNLSLRVTDHGVFETSTARELRLSLKITGGTESDATRVIPVRLELNGTLTEIPVEMNGPETELRDYSISLEGQPERGWGRVTIPSDANSEDNEFYFVYDQPPPLQTVIVTEDPDNVSALELAAGIAPDQSLETQVSVITPDQVLETDWESTALILWDAPVPSAQEATVLSSLAEQDRCLIFFPPEDTNSAEEFAGVAWGEWQDEADAKRVTTWIQDQDLLANVQSGAALPVGELEMSRYRLVEGERITLATLETGEPWLCRAITDLSNIYFCTTATRSRSSSLAENGIVLYVMIQRALAAGAGSLSAARQLIAGESQGSSSDDWTPMFTSERTLSTMFEVQAGAYQTDEQLLAVNRSEGEDNPKIVTTEQVSTLFRDLPFDLIEEEVGSGNALMREIWPTFLVVMMIMLLGEAVLCLPRRIPQESTVTPLATGRMAA